LYSKYKPDIGKLTKANSTVADGRVIYIVKKDSEGKSGKFIPYVAYDYKTRVQLTFDFDKSKLIERLNKLNITERIENDKSICG